MLERKPDACADVAAPPMISPERRSFIKRLGLGTSVLLVPSVFAACDDDDDDMTGPGVVTLDFSDPVDVLNFAYALEQLEAAFYTQVIATPYANITARETTILTDIRDHEIAHREFLERAIPTLGTRIAADLQFDFSAVDFTSRASVLATALTFENLGVGAYNGAGRFLVDVPDVLTVAGKIVSVEARHASAIALLIQEVNEQPFDNDFAPNALDPALTPAMVLQAAGGFFDGVVINVTNAG